MKKKMPVKTRGHNASSGTEVIADLNDPLPAQSVHRLMCFSSACCFTCFCLHFIIKFRYNANSDWLKQRALSEYRCTE